MKRSMKCMVAMCVAGAVGTVYAEGQPDTAETIKARIVGNTVCGVDPAGVASCIFYGPDGKISGKSGTYTATGAYEVRDDGTVCTKWDNPQWKSGCAKQYPNDKGEIQAIDDSGKSTFLTQKIETGNKL